MKLTAFKDREGHERIGVKTDQGIVDLKKASERYQPRHPLPQSIHEAISDGRQATANIEEFMKELAGKAMADLLVDETTVEFMPCVPNPGKLICVGLNYRKHAEETGSPIPQYPILFNKFNNSLAAHREKVRIPNETEQMDYEVELAVVIGKEAQRVKEEEALNYVYGYCTVNDLSARDLQFRTNQWLLGKSGDGFCPLGPYLVTTDEIDDPNSLWMKTYVNGELRQNSNTSDMIFHCNQIISYVSRYMTLQPGDIILTGTPEGVAMGYPVGLQPFLKPGDEVIVEIEKLGALSNRMIE